MKIKVIAAVLIVVLGGMMLAACGGGGGEGGGGGGGGTPCAPPMVDVTGTWLIKETSTNNNCGETITAPYTMTFTQTGSSLSAYVPSSNLNFSGQICGSTVNWTGSYPEDGGTTTIDSLSAAVSSDGNSLSGSDSWHWTGSSTCSGTTQFTGTRQSGGTTIPAAPSPLSATALSSSSIALNWTDNSDDETGFKIERSLSSTSGFTQIYLAGANVQDYTDNSVSASTTYYYRVKAYNSAGDSGYSNTDNTTTPPVSSDTQLPTVPTGLTATAQSSSQIDLSWTASTDNVGVTGYKIYTNAGTSFKFVTATSTSMTGLSASTQYCYTVSAYDAAGNESAKTAQKCATTQVSLDIQDPTTPTGLTATAPSSSQIDLSWTASSDNVGVTGYKVYSGTGTSPLKSVTATSTSMTGLSASTQYCYTVSAYDAAGNESAKTAQKCATTQAGNPTLTVTKAGTGTGTVTSSPTGINCGSTCSYSYTSGTPVTLTASPGAGQTFTGWTDCDVISVTTGACTMTVDANKTVTATFNQQTSTTVSLSVLANNMVAYNTMDSAVANTAFKNYYPTVGINSIWNFAVGQNELYASLVKFDASALTNKTIDSATLKLEVRSNGVGYYPKNFMVAGVDQSWTTAVTWNKWATFSYYGAQSFSYPTNSSQVYNIDLKTIVQYWANGTKINNGLQFASTDYTCPYNVDSLDAYDFWIPTLTVTYH